MPDADQDLPEPEEVGGDVNEDGTDVHRSSFKSVQSTAQARKKPRSEARLVVQFIVDIGPEALKELGKEHGRQYVDGVDFGRALLRWLHAEHKDPDLHMAALNATLPVKYEVEK